MFMTFFGFAQTGTVRAFLYICLRRTESEILDLPQRYPAAPAKAEISEDAQKLDVSLSATDL